MLNRLFLFLVLFSALFTSCNKKTNPIISNKAIISGQIANDTSFTQIRLSSYLEEIAGDTKTYPDKNGKFKFTLQLPSEFEFILSYNGAFSTLLVNPGDSIFVTINSKDSLSFAFSGTNGKIINDLNNLEKIISKTKIIDSNLFQRYKEDEPEQYLKFRTSLYNDNLKKLDDILNKSNVSTKIKKFYKSRYQVNYGFELIHFLSMASVYQGLKTTKEGIPVNYIKTIDSLYTESIDNFHVWDYHNFINLYSQMFNFENRDTLIYALKNKDILLADRIQMDYRINKFSGFQKDYLLTKSINSLIDNSYITDEVFNKYMNEVSMNYFQSFLNKKYNEYKLILNSKSDTNNIHLIDLSGSDTTSLFEVIKKNHIGKTLYVDVWGTWCGSCISKFAYLPELRKSLDNKNIEFLFLAITSPKNQWEKVITNHKLEGYHYLLNDKQKRELYSMVYISGIPHYFIINKNGIVEIPEAKGPNESQVDKTISNN